MSRIKLNAPVRTPDGRITTITDLLDAGECHVVKIDNYGRNMVTKYFAEFPSGDCWEIGQKAYESRKDKGQSKEG